MSSASTPILLCSTLQQASIRKLIVAGVLSVMTIEILYSTASSFQADLYISVEILSAILLVAFYMSPSFQLLNIVKSKDASSISLPLAITSLLNCIGWAVYGWFFAKVYFGFANLIGILSCILQLSLRLAYKHKSNQQTPKPQVMTPVQQVIVEGPSL
jgi:uncharacterized protein with PQ loop repeat